MNTVSVGLRIAADPCSKRYRLLACVVQAPARLCVVAWSPLPLSLSSSPSRTLPADMSPHGLDSRCHGLVWPFPIVREPCGWLAACVSVACIPTTVYSGRNTNVDMMIKESETGTTISITRGTTLQLILRYLCHVWIPRWPLDRLEDKL